jgi:hypothetical protein
VQDQTRTDTEQELNEVKTRSQVVLKATTGVLVALVAAGGIWSLVTTPETNPWVLRLYVFALIMAGLGCAAGLAVNWEAVVTRWQAVLDRMRFLLIAQIITLSVVALSLVAGAALLFWGEPPPIDPAKLEPTLTASAQAPRHQDCAGNWFTYEPENVIDGQDDTAWRIPGEGEGEWIALRYPRPVKVSAIGIIPGHDKIDSECGIDRFFSLHVVHEVFIEFSDGTAVPKRFDRNRSKQWLHLDSPKATTSVRVEIKRTYPPGDDSVDETAISEIEIR